MPRLASRWPRRLVRTAIVLGVTLVASAATFRPAQLVLDINTVPTPVPSYASLVCDAPGFSMLVSEHDYEPYRLWRTDGTASGTAEIMQFPTQTASSGFSCLHAQGTGPVYFQYTSDGGSPQLWRSDGTTAGTFRLLEQPSIPYEIRLLGAVGSQVLFAAAASDTSGAELFRSDGTVAGTQLLREFTPGPDNTVFGLHAVQLNGQLMFAANGALWATDGTAAGTRVVIDGASHPDYLEYADIVLLGNRVIFSRVTDVGDSELWASDGTTPGSTLLATFSIPPGTPVITALTAVSSSRAVFALPGDAGPPYAPLWRTDGTVSGTQRLRPSLPDLDYNDAEGLHKVAGGAVFMAITNANGREPWFTDGTDAGTYLLRDQSPGAGSSGHATFFPVPGGQVYFSSIFGEDAWFTDGTVSGTWSVSALDPQLAADWVYLPPIPLGSNFALWSYVNSGQGFGYRRTLWRVSPATRSITRVQDFTPRDFLGLWPLRGGRMLFGLDVDPYGAEPWISDGTAAGTRLLRNLEPESVNGSSDPAFGFNLGDLVLFGANDGTQGRGLWRSDGTAAGTQRLAAGAPVGSVYNMPYVQLGSSILYTGQTAAGFPELWRTDGTVAGTVLVRDLSGPAIGSPQPQASYPGSCGAGYVAANGTAYYGASPAGLGRLFRTDGTTAGTVELGSFPTNSLFFQQTSVCVLGVSGGSVYFQAMDAATAQPVLWRNNGQVGGSEKVLTAGGATVSAPRNMMEMSGSLYFLTIAQGQWGLWRLAPGDPVARLAVPRTWSSNPAYPDLAVVLGNTLLFRDSVVINGLPVYSMYRSDGTATGTYLLSSTQGLGPQQPRFGALIGNRYLYSGANGASGGTGFDLWLTDGTSAGTTAIRVPVSSSQAYPYPEFVNFNGLTYFAVTQDTAGDYVTQIWRTDGTTAGTERVNTTPVIDRGPWGPHFMVTGQKLLFAAQTDAESVELWSIENEAPTAQADTSSTTSPAAVSVDVLANDADPDGSLARASLRITAQPANGSVAIDAAAGTVRYTPAAGFSGADTFRYTVTDTQGRESAPALVTVNVAAAPGGGGGGGSGGGSTGGGGGGSAGWLSLLALLALLRTQKKMAEFFRTPPFPLVRSVRTDLGLVKGLCPHGN